MSLTGYATLLLLLGIITPGYAADPAECNFPNNTALNKDYQLAVSPKTLSNDTVYIVYVTGNANESVRVLLQAQTNNTAVGKWSTTNGKVTCSGEPLLNFIFNANSSLIANWTSPSSSVPASVDVKVLITNGNVTYTLSEKLLSGSANSVQPLSMLLASILVITSKLL